MVQLLEGALNELPLQLGLSGLPVGPPLINYMGPVTGYTLESQVRPCAMFYATPTALRPACSSPAHSHHGCVSRMKRLPLSFKAIDRFCELQFLRPFASPSDRETGVLRVVQLRAMLGQPLIQYPPLPPVAGESSGGGTGTLSAGAIAGIAIGTFAAAVAVIALVLMGEYSSWPGKCTTVLDVAVLQTVKARHVGACLISYAHLHCPAPHQTSPRLVYCLCCADRCVLPSQSCRGGGGATSGGCQIWRCWIAPLAHLCPTPS